MFRKMLLGVLCFVLWAMPVVVQAFQDADGFDYPIGNAYRQGKEINDNDEWYDTNDFQNNQQFPDHCFHSGDDWNKKPAPNGDLGEPVKAIGHGKVRRVGGNNTLGGAVAIEHHYKGNAYYSIYWHVNVSVADGQDVKRGDVIATIGSFSAVGVHLHMEMRDYFSDTTGLSYPNDGKHRTNTQGKYCENAGYYQTQADMALDHLMDPTKFIDEHRVATWHPNGTLIRAAGDDAVYYLQNGKRRGLTSPQALTNNGY